MKIQRTLLAGAVSLGLLCTTTLQAGVPVVDGIANGFLGQLTVDQAITNKTGIAHWVEEAAKWGKDYAHYASELKAYADQLNDLRSGNYYGLITKIGGDFFAQGGAMAGMNIGQYSDAGNSNYLLNNSACGKENSSANFSACRAERNMKSKAMNDMQKMLDDMASRQTDLAKIIAKLEGAKRTGKEFTPGEMQQMSMEINAMQALLQADTIKLQMTLAMHKQREELYRQEQVDSAQALLKGNGEAVSLESALNGVSNGFGLN